MSDTDAATDDLDELEPAVGVVGDADDELDAADAADEIDGNRIEGGVARAVLEYLARSIVDDAESVVVDVEERRGSMMLRLHVAPGDMGRVIGRRGRVAQAIRTVVRAAGASEGVNAEVDIVD
ncbi:MAG TPA: KH domain-containing protein [Acidimicrobiales bacterium]|nr:KH domain-containing protein [Acidimicrobiales bacterium]